MTTPSPLQAPIELDPPVAAAPRRPAAAFFIGGTLLQDLFNAAAITALSEALGFVAEPRLDSVDAVSLKALPLREIEVVIGGWEMPRFDRALLDQMPALKIIFYAAGSIGPWSTSELLARRIRIVTASAANAVPVAEYASAMIRLCLKRVLPIAREMHRLRAFPGPEIRASGAGGYKSTVGLLSLGLIGRQTVHSLRHADLNLLAYDPHVSTGQAKALGVTLCSLETLFERSDVVSIHTPWLPETAGLVTGALIRTMKHNASLINTSRGPIIREQELIEALRARPDLQAVLDVTDPEPPEAGCGLFDLPNVLLTPHIAGSIGAECARMGNLIVSEVRRYVSGQPLEHELQYDSIQTTAHATRL